MQTLASVMVLVTGSITPPAETPSFFTPDLSSICTEEKKCVSLATQSVSGIIEWLGADEALVHEWVMMMMRMMVMMAEAEDAARLLDPAEPGRPRGRQLDPLQREPLQPGREDREAQPAPAEVHLRDKAAGEPGGAADTCSCTRSYAALSREGKE